MAAHENLSEYQFVYRPTGVQRKWAIDPDEAPYHHAVYAVHKPTNTGVGQMLWHADGHLHDIQVGEEHQRKGVATGMVRHAQRVAEASAYRVPQPSRAWIETEEGSAWASAMQERGYLG